MDSFNSSAEVTDLARETQDLFGEMVKISLISGLSFRLKDVASQVYLQFEPFWSSFFALILEFD
jgi:hypothetical protein